MAKIEDDTPVLPSTTHDKVATAVQSAGAGDLGIPEVVRFCGYLGEGPSEATSRIYLHPWFHTWLTVLDDDIVAQVKTTTQDGKSYVWVKRDVTIIQCRSTIAADLAQALEDDVDPSAIYPKH
jgi:hypothetical protein